MVDTLTGMERLSANEIRVDHIMEKLEDMSAQHADMIAKVDALLELKNKGMGAFWLGSILIGSGFMAFIVTLIEGFKGIFNGH